VASNRPGVGGAGAESPGAALRSASCAPGSGEAKGPSHNADRQLTGIARPDNQSLTFGYDSAGRLNGITLPTGQFALGYDATTGRLRSVSGPTSVAQTFTSDGLLFGGETWSGPVSGNLALDYDANFRTTAQTVNGTALSFQYDNDGLSTQAGNLAVQRDAQTGLMTGTSLGTISDAVTYDGFGTRAAYTASAGATALYNVQYTRDLLGRITRKSETIGGTTDTFTYAYDPRGRLIQVQKTARRSPPTGMTQTAIASSSPDRTAPSRAPTMRKIG
jgi:YD repeat-containing protein